MSEDKTLDQLVAEYNELARANGKDETQGFESLQKARSALKKLQKAIDKAANAPASASRPGIGSFAKGLLIEGKSNKETLEAVLVQFPEAKTTAACIAYYRTKLIGEGKLTSSRKAKAEAPAEAA